MATKYQMIDPANEPERLSIGDYRRMRAAAYQMGIHDAYPAQGFRFKFQVDAFELGRAHEEELQQFLHPKG